MKEEMKPGDFPPGHSSQTTVGGGKKLLSSIFAKVRGTVARTPMTAVVQIEIIAIVGWNLWRHSSNVPNRCNHPLLNLTD
jgi:hypothetical protein